jgi:hypothetical protein
MLQLLQIVGFIWTWARDVYRPQIRRSLANLPNPYNRSPSLESQNASLPSNFPESRVQSFSQTSLDPGEPEEEEDMSMSGTESNPQVQETEYEGQLRPHDASSHTFLRWAESRDLSKSWALNSCIRHSDIVKFSFRLLELPETEDNLTELISSLYDRTDGDEATEPIYHLANLTRKNPYTFVLMRGHLPEIERSWTGTEAQSSYKSCIADQNEEVRVTFFFRSYCQPKDWQIIREMHCIVWSPAAARMFGDYFGSGDDLEFNTSSLQHVLAFQVSQQFQQLVSLSGKYSVACALLGASFVLQPAQDSSQNEELAHWLSPQDGGLPRLVIAQLSTLFDSDSSGEDPIRLYQYQSHSLLQVRQDQQHLSPMPLSLLQQSAYFGELEAVMAIKPETWHECPRFCLFVLLDHDFDDEARLRGLLRARIDNHEFLAAYGYDAQDQPAWSKDDWTILQDWRKYFSEENMVKF